jgi:hypothetical protein
LVKQEALISQTQGLQLSVLRILELELRQMAPLREQLDKRRAEILSQLEARWDFLDAPQSMKKPVMAAMAAAPSLLKAIQVLDDAQRHLAKMTYEQVALTKLKEKHCFDPDNPAELAVVTSVASRLAAIYKGLRVRGMYLELRRTVRSIQRLLRRIKRDKFSEALDQFHADMIHAAHPPDNTILPDNKILIVLKFAKERRRTLQVVSLNVP